MAYDLALVNGDIVWQEDVVVNRDESELNDYFWRMLNTYPALYEARVFVGDRVVTVDSEFGNPLFTSIGTQTINVPALQNYIAKNPRIKITSATLKKNIVSLNYYFPEYPYQTYERNLNLRTNSNA